MIKLLKIEPWKLFCLIVLLPMFIQSDWMKYIVEMSNSQLLLNIYNVISILISLVYFFWIYLLARNLYAQLPNTVKMSIIRFNIFFFIPLIYGILLFVYTDFFDQTKLMQNSAFIDALLPFHFFIIFCVLYCFYFNAKALKSIEFKKPVEFRDYVFTFFLIWFYPIGIWFIQPRVNSLFIEKREEI